MSDDRLKGEREFKLDPNFKGYLPVDEDEPRRGMVDSDPNSDTLDAQIEGILK